MLVALCLSLLVCMSLRDMLIKLQIQALLFRVLKLHGKWLLLCCPLWVTINANLLVKSVGSLCLAAGTALVQLG